MVFINRERKKSCIKAAKDGLFVAVFFSIFGLSQKLSA